MFSLENLHTLTDLTHQQKLIQIKLKLMSISFQEMSMLYYSKKSVCWWVIINFSDVLSVQRLTVVDYLIRAWRFSISGPALSQSRFHTVHQELPPEILYSLARSAHAKPGGSRGSQQIYCFFVSKFDKNGNLVIHFSPLLAEIVKWRNALIASPPWLAILQAAPPWRKYGSMFCLSVRDVDSPDDWCAH